MRTFKKVYCITIFISLSKAAGFPGGCYGSRPVTFGKNIVTSICVIYTHKCMSINNRGGEVVKDMFLIFMPRTGEEGLPQLGLFMVILADVRFNITSFSVRGMSLILEF